MTRYVFDDGPDVDLDTEDVRLLSGERLTTKLANEIVQETSTVLGRPSLTAPGRHTPRVSTRVPPAVVEGLDAIAEREGVSRSEITRRALEEFVAHATRAS